MLEGMFNGMFGRIDRGMCRLSPSGEIAIKTSNGYKVYNIDKGTLVNCANFVFNISEEMFFVIPTNKVVKGDIILIGGRPKCVIEATKNKITAIDYESSEIKQILPERHIFFGKTYFYGKIVSMFGSTNFIKGKKGMPRMMQFMMMMEMMKGMSGSKSGSGALALPGGTDAANPMAAMLPMMMMGNMFGGGNSENMFEGMFDFGFDNDEDDDESTEAEVVEADPSEN